jgi:hypothetical protein
MTCARVVYHFPCVDGAFAALAAHMYFRQHRDERSDVKFVPARVDVTFSFKENEASFPAGCTVYMCDYVGSRALLLDLAARCSKVVLLDHHKTSADIIETLKKENALPANGELLVRVRDDGR